MPNLLEQSAAWLADQRDTHLSSSVTYQRGGDSVHVPATTGQTVFRFDDAAGGTVRFVSQDFLIRAGDLVINGEAIEPRRGDQIIETANGKVYTHEVMPFGNDEPEWRYSDPQRTTYRIHTKLIEQSPVEVTL
ncbi:MAG: hypothetical protein AAF711_00360 [Planctomycetota bacterium]